MQFEIPKDDHAEFYALPQDLIHEVRRSLKLLSKLQAMGGPNLANREKVALKLRGFSAGNLKTKWYKFAQRGWRGLVNQSALAKPTLPAEFLTYWRELVGGNDKRYSVRTAYARFLSDFRAGKRIEGLGTWKDWHAKHLRYATPDSCPWDMITQPPLLSERSCARIPLNTAELEAQRKGVGAARKHMATLRTDLSTLRLFEVIVFDDFEPDIQFVDYATNQVCKLVGLAAMDAATRKIIAFSLRPRLMREDGTRVALAREDMLRLCGRILKQYGHPTAWKSIWVMENATATVSDHVGEILDLISGGNVEVRKTLMYKQNALLGGFGDTAGNPNAKGILEKFWHTAWLRLGWEMGQTGSLYTLRPGTLAARTDEFCKLIKAGSSLPMELKKDLTEGYFHSVEDATQVVGAVFESLADRLGHKIEGFEKVLEWRWRGQAQWQNADLTPLPPVPAAAFAEAVQTRPRLETCNERARRLLARDGAEFTKVSDAALALLFVDSVNLTYDGSGCFLVERKNKPSRMFKADHLELIEGVKYRLVHEGGEFNEAYLLNPAGQFVGTAHHVTRLEYLNMPGVAKMIEEKESRIKAMLARVKGRQSTDDLAKRIDQLGKQEAILRNMPGLEIGGAESDAVPGLPELWSARDAKNVRRKDSSAKAMKAFLKIAPATARDDFEIDL